MEKDIKILIVDDHQVVREGLGRMLEQDAEMEVVGQGTNNEDTLFQARTLSPNIVLMDIKMPGVDGIELTRQLKQRHPSCKVIMLTLYEEYLTQAMEAGASGYLLKDIKREQLVQSIKRVHQGEIVIDEDILSNSQVIYARQRAGEEEEGPDTIFEEVQLILPPPVEANQLMRFATHTEETLQSRVLQVIGSWQEGTAMTIVLNKAAPLPSVLSKLHEIPEVKTVGENPLSGEAGSSLLKKASAVPRLNNRTRKTIFVTLGKS